MQVPGRVGADDRGQLLRAAASQAPDAVQAGGVQLRGGGGSDAPQRLHGEGVEEVQLPVRVDAQEAVRLAARTEGLVLDPVYTGKAMAGLIAAVRDGRISGTVVFWHTGGSVALFADEFAAF